MGTAGAADHLGPVPPRNQPRRSTRGDQDKPDLTAFARRLGIGRRAPRLDADTSTAADSSSIAEEADTSSIAEEAESRWARLAGVPVAATSLSLRATEAALRRSADTIAALRQRLRSDDPAS